MTNKPMLSVECIFCGCRNEIPAASWGCVTRVEGQCFVCKRPIVWAADDKPAVQHKGDPVEEKSAALQDMTDLFVEAHDESVAVGKANFVLAALEKIYDSGYRKQPTPVNFITPDCPDCACVQDGQCLCIPSKPAAQHQGEPVAVVMPERADEERPEFFSGGDHKDIEHDFDEERGRAIGWNECIDELERLNNIVTPGFKMPPQGWGVKVQAAISPALELSDEQILEAMRHSINSADGGYVVDTAPENVIAAGRALLESARLNGLKT